jgi:hypothetical protein
MLLALEANGHTNMLLDLEVGMSKCTANSIAVATIVNMLMYTVGLEYIPVLWLI